MGEEEKIEARITRRSFLKTATITAAAIGVAGIGATAIPFIEAMNPTRDILAAGKMEVDISNLKEGELKKVLWRSEPIFILRRTPEMIKITSQTDPVSLKDPATVSERVLRPDLFVSIGICTHLGCIPQLKTVRLPGLEQPGFYCPCHGGEYDTVGRRLAGPPPENLHLLPYKFSSDTKIELGSERFTGYGADVREIQNLPKD